MAETRQSPWRALFGVYPPRDVMVGDLIDACKAAVANVGDMGTSNETEIRAYLNALLVERGRLLKVK